MRLPIPSSIPATLAKLMSRCWEEDSQSRPEFDVIRELLEAARHEFQDYDKSGEFRSLQVKFYIFYWKTVIDSLDQIFALQWGWRVEYALEGNFRCDE